MRYLNSSLRQASLLRELFTRVHVRVLGTLERPLQLFQLVRAERGPRAALFPLQSDPRLRLDIRRVAVVLTRPTFIVQTRSLVTKLV